MVPICLLIGYLLGVLFSRKYHPETKKEKIGTCIFVPLTIGVFLCLIFAGIKSNGKDYMFGYYFGGYILYTILPSIVTMITMLVKVEVTQLTGEDYKEASVVEDNDTIDSNNCSEEVQLITPIPGKTVINEIDKNPESITEIEGPIDKRNNSKNDEPEKQSQSIVINKPEDVICHLIKITSNIESTVYLDCEKIGTVSDGKMIIKSIPEGPYLIRCVSIYDEIIDDSFELKKDELFNFKFKVTNSKKRKWF